MKKKSKIGYVIFSFIAILVILACGIGDTGREIVSENTNLYDKGVTFVANYQEASANHFLKINACYAKMDRQAETAGNYYEAVNANTQSWTGNFKDEKSELEGLMDQYLAAGGDPSKLNLAELANNGALPSDLQTGMMLYINAVVQAPPPVIDSEITKQLLSAQSECYDSIVFTGSIVNDKAKQYNEWRKSVTGEIVTQVSETVGFPLPEELPYITGGNADDTQLK